MTRCTWHFDHAAIGLSRAVFYLTSVGFYFRTRGAMIQRPIPVQVLLKSKNHVRASVQTNGAVN